MTSNQIIKELLARMYVTRPSLDAITCSKELSGSLSENFAEDFTPSNEWLNTALGGEAKALWDMVNESPYTPLETELLQRLQYIWHQGGLWDGPALNRMIIHACSAPTEKVDLWPLQTPFEETLPWLYWEVQEAWAEMKKDDL